MRLQPDEAVDDVASRLFELAGPGDVSALIEPGLDLHHHDDLLARLGRVDQRVDDRRLAAGPVQRLLDRQHPRVVGGLVDQPLDRRGERVVGVLDEDVAFGDGGEDAVVLGDRPGGRDERRVPQLADVQVGDGEQPAQVERPGHPVDGPPVDIELGDQLLEYVGRHRVLDLEPDGGLEPAPHQLPLHGLQQVLGEILVDLEVPDAGDAERVMLDDLHVTEQVGQVRGDDVLDRHVPVLRQGQEPGQQRRDLDPGEDGAVGPRVRDHDGQVERQAGDERERMGRVHHQRGEHRVDALPEQVTEGVTLVRPRVPSSAGSRSRARPVPG